MPQIFLLLALFTFPRCIVSEADAGPSGDSVVDKAWWESLVGLNKWWWIALLHWIDALVSQNFRGQCVGECGVDVRSSELTGGHDIESMLAR